jgi:molecular chaperone HscB
MQNYFELLELEQTYNLSPKVLHTQYLKMQAKHHPDMSLEKTTQSADINSAYNTLKDDLTRAEYILKLHNVELKSSQDLDLHKIWGLFETIEKTSDISSLKSMMSDIEKDYELEINLLHIAFSDIKLNSSDPRIFQDAIDIIISMKYITSVLNAIKNKIKLCQL